MPIPVDELNPAQRDAVVTTSGPVLVLAGAGTGKTRVITFRMVYLIEQGISPEAILALTFTNKAAREMKERYIELGKDGATPVSELRKLFAGTFHSFCVKVLRRHINALGYKRNFTIYDDLDQRILIKQCIQKVEGANSKTDPSKVKFLIGLAKNKGHNVSKLSDDASLARIAKSYQKEMKLRNAVDFDDLLVLMVELLENHPEIREELRAKYRYLLVDEYQDTNHLQFEIVRLLASPRQDVCVVGDDDQSIYSWRGAESTHILEFDSQFPNAHVVRLEQNYRCTPRILNAANKVIRNNSRRHLKTLWSDGDVGPMIRLVEAQGDKDESEWVTGDMLRKAQEHNLKWEGFAILYRANHLSRAFEQELRRFRIPYRVIGGQSFYERKEVKDVLAYLQTMLNPDDDGSLLRIINYPARGIGDSTREELIARSRETAHSVWHELQRSYHNFPNRAATALSEFNKLVTYYQERFRESTGWSDTLKDLLDDTGYWEELKRTAKDGNELTNRTENVQEIVSALAGFEERGVGGMNEFVDGLVLDQTEDDRDDDDAGGVTLMTLHAAKGLEFPRVYIVGLEEGILPHERSKLEGNVEEERRLFYVGITRAKKELALTYCGVRRRYGQEEHRRPSPFIEELPEDDVEQVDATAAVRAEVQPEQAIDRLAALRKKLEGGSEASDDS